MKTIIRFTATIACAIFAPGAAAQTQSIVESAARARAIADSAVVAHGGVEALNAAKRMHVVLRGQDFWRNQSVNVSPPYDARDAVAELLLDLPAGKMVTRQTGAYPGDLNFASRRFTDGDRSNAVFEASGMYFSFRAPP